MHFVSTYTNNTPNKHIGLFINFFFILYIFSFYKHVDMHTHIYIYIYMRINEYVCVQKRFKLSNSCKLKNKN